MSEFMRVNGVRVNVEKYYRKMRKLERQRGRVVPVKSRWGKQPRTVHLAKVTLIPPTGRQVYPRIGYNIKCGALPTGLTTAYGDGGPMCERCKP